MREIDYRGGDGTRLFAAACGRGPVVVLLHGGGPDHHSLLPMAERLADRFTVVVPDVRGYGRSVCRDPALHTWSRYADDVIALLDHLAAPEAVVGGTGLGGTIALRAALASARVRAVVVISAEDIEDDEMKLAETALMDRFADRVRADGIEAAWELFLPHLQPLIGTLVRSAIPRADPGSVAAAAAIGRDRSFGTLDELTAIEVPVLIVPGADERHPAELAERMSATIPHATLARNVSFDALRTADDLAGAVVPEIRRFLDN
ncbi:alpha/beta fold hydrolase [Rhodococcus opacus]|uniref:alpha/beta fold hydrolase n=1 Tax=Rhodococcus opacus TaxID=37919 RepID=UPI001C441461|nr:alpha/beta hydrolase [Rhodococcus opacus]MBV6761488.1 alpha/beta fold hydrolase [Rhodococcus opacus]